MATRSGKKRNRNMQQAGLTRQGIRDLGGNERRVTKSGRFKVCPECQGRGHYCNICSGTHYVVDNDDEMGPAILVTLN